MNLDKSCGVHKVLLLKALKQKVENDEYSPTSSGQFTYKENDPVKLMAIEAEEIN